jgi:hypothetical protein
MGFFHICEKYNSLARRPMARHNEIACALSPTLPKLSSCYFRQYQTYEKQAAGGTRFLKKIRPEIRYLAPLAVCM